MSECIRLLYPRFATQCQNFPTLFRLPTAPPRWSERQPIRSVCRSDLTLHLNHPDSLNPPLLSQIESKLGRHFISISVVMRGEHCRVMDSSSKREWFLPSWRLLRCLCGGGWMGRIIDVVTGEREEELEVSWDKAWRLETSAIPSPRSSLVRYASHLRQQHHSKSYTLIIIHSWKLGLERAQQSYMQRQRSCIFIGAMRCIVSKCTRIRAFRKVVCIPLDLSIFLHLNICFLNSSSEPIPSSPSKNRSSPKQRRSSNHQSPMNILLTPFLHKSFGLSITDDFRISIGFRF